VGEVFYVDFCIMGDRVLADQSLLEGEAVFEPRLEEVIDDFVQDVLVLLGDYLVQSFHAFIERFFRAAFTVH